VVAVAKPSMTKFEPLPEDAVITREQYFLYITPNFFLTEQYWGPTRQMLPCGNAKSQYAWVSFLNPTYVDIEF
jgi:hypothetical protein